eukprot:GHVU01147694.1.p3 GENE.GHVU01147694.1~~GHVU01147694.1.p3  ORF type:complete len:107 (-),score=27.51 GHVU01147694.1:55-375(-)
MELLNERIEEYIIIVIIMRMNDGIEPMNDWMIGWMDGWMQRQRIRSHLMAQRVVERRVADADPELLRVKAGGGGSGAAAQRELCVICREPFQAAAKILQCGHFFHV